MVRITHEQNIISWKTRLDGITHEQTTICRQLFAGHVVGSRPMEREEKMSRMVIIIDISKKSFVSYSSLGFIKDKLQAAV